MYYLDSNRNIDQMTFRSKGAVSKFFNRRHTIITNHLDK